MTTPTYVADPCAEKERQRTMRGSPTEDLIDEGVVFHVRTFCPQLKDKQRDELKDVEEVTLVALDTGREATHELGEQLPSLRRLRFRQSTLQSFRDLGCDLVNLRVLHAARCGVSDFDGITALPALEELYLSFNDVEDCTALAFQEHLVILDLESNRLSEICALDALGTCEQLSCLTLLGCPVASLTNYRDDVAKALPTLEVLDDNALNASDGDATPRPSTLEECRSPQDEALLDEFIRQETELTACAVKDSSGHSTHSPSHSCWAELRELRNGTQTSASSALTHGGRGALNGRLRPKKKEIDPEALALASLRSRAEGPAKVKQFLASPSQSGFRVLSPPPARSPDGRVISSPVARRPASPKPERASPNSRLAAAGTTRLRTDILLRPATASRASPRTDLVRELLGSPPPLDSKSVAEAPLTSAQKTTLRRRARPKKKLHHAVSTLDLARRSAAKGEFSRRVFLDPALDPATREV